MSASAIAKAKSLVAKAKNICLLTGAGISAESGIKTFRDAGGLWEEHSIEDVATPEGFERDPRLVWAFYNARRKAAAKAAPNAGHLALSRLELGLKRKLKQPRIGSGNGNGYENGNGHGPGGTSQGPVTILTQNIDGLHQQAGSQNVVELHDSIWKVRCTGCARIETDFPVQLPILPYCEDCKKLLRPHVVWFGESLDPHDLRAGELAVLGCDLFLVVGTSALVQPAASFPVAALQRGIPVIEINPEETALSEQVSFALRGKAGEILPKLISD